MPRALIIEDDLDLCKTYANLLQSMGYEVESVQSGSKAMILLSRRSLNLVILDMQLQGSSGVSVLSYIRQRRFQAHVIVISSYPEQAERTERLWNIEHYLIKPVSTEHLREVVRKIEAANC